MSLSDYSSDDSLELEQGQITAQAVKGAVNDKMNTKRSSSSDAGSSTMMVGALAALAVAGVAASSLYLRQYFTGRKQTTKGQGDKTDAGARKDLRRKRGRDTSEESGGEASGSSPTAAAHANKPKVLRKTLPKSRQRRPPVRAPAFEVGITSKAPKEISEEEKPADEASTLTKEAPAKEVNHERESTSVVQPPKVAEVTGSGTVKEATDKAPTEKSAGSASKKVKEQGKDSAKDPEAAAAPAKEEAPAVEGPFHEKPAAGPAAAEPVQEETSEADAHKSPSQRSLPDLVSKPLSPANFTQPSLDTFTADCDVLDRAVETVDAGKEHSAGEKEGAEEAPAKAAASMDKQESKQHSKEEEHTDKRGAAAEESAEKAVSKVDKADKKPEGKPEKPAQQATKGKAAPDTAAGAAGAAAAAAQAECKPKEAPAAEQQSSESKPEHKTEATAAKKETESKPKESTAVENQAGESKPEATAASGEGKGEEESTKKKAPVSDEQEAILKRGDSLLKEADQHEPRNIQLVRRMQAEVDEQDDMLDFSKTDAYRSSEAKKHEGRASASAGDKSQPNAGAGDKKEVSSDKAGPDSKAKDSSEAAKQPEPAQAAVEREPSVELVADTTPDGDQLDLSSAEVDTVTSITSQKPKKAEEDQEDAKGSKAAAGKEIMGSEEAAKASKPSRQAEAEKETAVEKAEAFNESAPKESTESGEKSLGETSVTDKEKDHKDAPSKGKPDVELVPVPEQRQPETRDADKTPHSKAEQPSKSSSSDAEPHSKGVTKAVTQEKGTATEPPVSAGKPTGEEEAPEAVAEAQPEEHKTASSKPNGNLKAPAEHPAPTTAHAEAAKSKDSADSVSKPAGSTDDKAESAAESSKTAVAKSKAASRGAAGEVSKGAEQDGAPENAAYDPLGMDTADDNLPVSEVAPDQEADAEVEDVEIRPQNNTERDVELNLAVALRMIEERGNIAAAERTLQKQLIAVKESKEAIRPHFTQRLTGTLADVIARHAQQEAAIQQGRGSHSQQHDRMPEIIGLLQTALQAAKECDTPSRTREAWRLGSALNQAGRLEEAELLFREEVKHCEQQLGPESPNTQQSRTYLANVLAKLGKKAEACKLLSDASEQLEQQAKELASSKGADFISAGAEDEGPDMLPQATATISAAKCSVQLANIQDEEKEYQEAEGSARRAVALMEATFGENHPRSATAYGTLASILKHMGGEGSLREAITLYERLQGITEDIHGLRNAQSALALRSIADVRLMLKEYGEAVTCLEKSLQIAGSVHGRDHPVMESYWKALAEVKTEAGDKQGAKEANRQALLIRSHASRPGGGPRSPREPGAARRGRGRSRR